ncbi:MAG: hypothetical protein JWL81_1688 [Verrucomicrobiales bacterium]|nr:hypothetical protein [Verrucomicrobiales bacterium]
MNAFMSAPSLKIAAWKICGVFLFGSLCSLPARTFTSTDGRKLEGEIVDADNALVSIKRTSDGRTLKVPLDSLSAENLKEIAEWRTAKALGKLVFTATKEKVSSTGKSSGGGALSTSREQKWSWVITVKNNSAHPLTGTTLRWAQVVERTDRNQGAVAGAAKSVARGGEGTLALPEIGAFQSFKIKTGPIVVQDYKYVSYSTSAAAGGGKTTTVTSEKWDEVLSGLSVDVVRGNLAPAAWKTGARTAPLPPLKP